MLNITTVGLDLVRHFICWQFARSTSTKHCLYPGYRLEIECGDGQFEDRRPAFGMFHDLQAQAYQGRNVDSMSKKSTALRRGREARKKIRAEPSVGKVRPVGPGLQGGRYRPLSCKDEQYIHESALTLLETVGLADAIPSCVEVVTSVGGKLDSNGRLCMPRALVEDTIAGANRRFTLCAQDPRYDIEPWGDRVHFGTGCGAVHNLNPMDRSLTPTTISDVYDNARVADSLEHVHFVSRTGTARDLPTVEALDINTCYASICGSSKHVGSVWSTAPNLRKSIEMLHMVAGDEKRWHRRPFVTLHCCFVVPPLKFAPDASECLEAGVRAGMPVLLLSAPQAGATAPASFTGTLIQIVAECLAGLVYVNAIRKGAPAILGLWPLVSDLRTGAMSGGSGEQAVLVAAAAQMGRFYDLPSGVASGMTDSKLPDAQAGFEKAYHHALIANAGANLIYESVGVHGSAMVSCRESMVIDNEILGAVLRTLRGVETDEQFEDLSIIRDVCLDGPGHYLGHADTLRRMETDFLYPVISDRLPPDQWVEQGSLSILDRAATLTRSILDNHYPTHIPNIIDERIREKFDIRIARPENV